MTNRVHSLRRFRGLTGPLALSITLSLVLLLPLLATACGENSEPEATGRVVEKEVVREVVVTPETPPGKELAQQVHEGETYTLVEYDDKLAVFTGSGSPVTDPSLAGEVLRSYAWRQTVQGLDIGAMSDAVDMVQDVDDRLSGVRETSNDMVAVFDELDSLSADVPLLGRVSAMDVLAETYPGMGAAADSIRTLDDELNSIDRDTVVLSGSLERITTLDPSDVSGDDMESLFQDAVEASDEMEARARSAGRRVTDVLNVARDLEDALWEASGTPLIGDSIAEAAGTTGVFAAELSNLADLMQEYIDTLGSLEGRFKEPIDVAERAQREYMSRWLQVPYDSTWRSVAGLQPTASATPEPAELATPAPIPTAAPQSGEIPFRIEWETSASTVEAGESFTLAVRMHDVQDSGEHGGISVSFPAVLEPGGSTGSYTSTSAEVEVIEYTSGLSNVTFHQPGATIYHRENNRQFPAEYLLVESDDPSWSTSDDRTLVLRITTKRGGDFPIQIRGWLCTHEYTGCVRRPADGPADDQQGWAVERMSVEAAVGSETETPSDRTPAGSVPFARIPTADYDRLGGGQFGVWSDGNTMWVADDRDNRIYAYEASTKTRTPDREISGVSAGVRDIWSDGETMWVADWTGDRILAYSMATKARVPDREFNGLAAAGNNHPEGIWSDGATMWVSDLVDDRIYAYDMATKAQDVDKEFDALVDFGSDLGDGPRGLWSDGVTMWIIGLPDSRIYAYDMLTKARDPGREFDTLQAAGNDHPWGAWSDGTTLWVTDYIDGKIYAYNMP